MRILRAAAIALAFMGSPVAAQQLVDEYVAYIGQNDLYNSRGQRLTQPWQVLRQDRANYHRFGKRDQMDTGDSFFTSTQRREAMERMVMSGTISRDAARTLVNGGAVVHVQVWSRGNNRYFLTVDVY